MPASYYSSHATARDLNSCSVCNPESWDLYCDGIRDTNSDHDDYSGSAPRESMAEMHGYGYQPSWIFNGDHAPWYGMEIEIEGLQSNLLRCAYKHLDGIAFCKEDSSVRGIEIVTHPMSYEWARDNFPWEEFFESARDEYGATVRNDSNGIHVHISRDGFGKEPGNINSPGREVHLYRWMKFIYRNQSQVERIARRESSSWAEFTHSHRKAQLSHATKGKLPKSNTPRIEYGHLIYLGRSFREYVADIGVPELVENSLSYSEWSRLPYSVQTQYGEYSGMTSTRFYPIVRTFTRSEYDRLDYINQPRGDETQYSRYSAINTQNEATLEVRVFASALYPQRAMSALELCAASVEYTRNLTTDDIIHRDGWSWTPFMEWAREHEYDALTAVNANPRARI